MGARQPGVPSPAVLPAGRLLKMLSSHERVAPGFALFTTPSWAVTSARGQAELARPVYGHLLNRWDQGWNLQKFLSTRCIPWSTPFMKFFLFFCLRGILPHWLQALLGCRVVSASLINSIRYNPCN